MSDANCRYALMTMFYHQMLRIHEKSMKQSLQFLVDWMVLILKTDGSQRPSHWQYLRFISLFNNNTNTKQFDVARVYVFVANVLMKNFEQRAVSFILDQSIKRCFEETSVLWGIINEIFSIYWPIPTHFQSQMLRVDALTEPQILFLFHPQSMLWQSPRITARRKFRIQLSVNKRRLIQELIQHYKLNIAAWWHGKRDMLVMLVETAGHTTTPKKYSNVFQ